LKANAGLFFDNVQKSFGGTQALRGVSLHVERGEIVALLGENGAGKSTLIKTLGGIHSADAGRVLIDGEEYHHKPGRMNERQKVAFIHQDLGLIEWMSVAENISMAVGFQKRAGLISWRRSEEVARRALALVECDFDPSTRVSALSRTEKSLVAIARALVVECDFLVLDEPTASLPADEVERLFAALKPLRAKGVGMIYVSHRLDEIFRVADRVAVLRDGQMVGMRDIAHTTPEELVTLIVGRKAREFVRPALSGGDATLKVSAMQTDRVGPVSFEMGRGEMLGLVGLRGAGHEDIGRALYGLNDFTGSVLLEGRSPDLANPSSAMASGIGFVARDRVVESIAPALTICENAFINPLVRGRGLLELMGSSREQLSAHELGALVGLSPNDPTLAIEALSGGNQQKVVVGRWLDTGRRLLIAEDPTAGVDVGAKAEIYNLLFDAMRSGMGVLIVSTDFEEVANICHRALVFSRGQLVAELAGVELSTESLIQAASAGEANEGKKRGHAIH
jgi:ribose transport system ATP-binding protein